MYVCLDAHVTLCTASGRGDLNVGGGVGFTEVLDDFLNVIRADDFKVDAVAGIPSAKLIFKARHNRGGKHGEGEDDNRTLIKSDTESDTDCRNRPKARRGGKTGNLEATLDKDCTDTKETTKMARKKVENPIL